jgi:glyoxalase family protein
MRFDGIHHVTCITADAPRNVDFYTRVLGLRLVKKTVNQDDPTVYHLFYADEEGNAGSDITFFEYPNARPGQAGDGMVHTVVWRVGSADAPRNLDFYTRVLGLRLVKKTVNQDDPTVYHLFYADEEGHAGSDITFFEYPNARPGQAGDGMVHTVVWRVGSADALEFWAERLSAEGHEVEADGESLRFENPEGLAHELVVAQVPDEPLVAHHPEIPREVALQGFEGVRAYGRPVDEFLTKLGFEQEEDGRWDTRAETRGGWIEYAEAPYVAGVGGAGTVHHVAWASTMEDHQAWHALVQEAGGNPTQIIDRFWFRSIYFREPAGVLFEIATLGPGFAADEDPAHLGEKLILPPAFEHLRDRVEPVLTPLPDPRADWAAR